MPKVRTNVKKQEEQHEDPNKIFVHETREVVLPDPPAIPAGKMVLRMVYKNGEHRDIIGESRFTCTAKAIKQAREDRMNFLSQDIISTKFFKK